MSITFESLSNVLKHRVRQKIILVLSEQGTISYVDLMNVVGIANTGKFNYHLKILGDLINKDENGKYVLSGKGQLAVQFLQKFAGKETESIPLPMDLKTFETRAFSLAQGFIWVLLVVPLIGVLFWWYPYFADRASAFIGDPTIPLMIFTLIAVSVFALFGMAALPKIDIDHDGIVVKYGIWRFFFALEDVTVDSKGHILKLGQGWTTFGWLIPFKEKECMNLLDKHVRTFRSKPFFLIYLLPLLILGFYSELARYLGVTLTPSLWAFQWGVTAAISMTIFACGAPTDMQIGKLGRGASAIVFGVSIGIVIFFLMFFSLQIH